MVETSHGWGRRFNPYSAHHCLCPRRTPMTNALSLRPGDRVPDFALPGLDGKLRKFIWSFTGNPVALLAVDDLGNLDAHRFAALVAACETSSVTPVVVAGNTVTAAAGLWAKLGGSAEKPPLPLHADYKILPVLLPAGRPGFRPTSGYRTGGIPCHT